MDFYIETNSTDAAYNLAFEEYALTHFKEGDILMLWQNDRTVVIGANQNAALEADRDYAKSNGIKIVRRITGGGAVYHDLGNLNYSFITDAEVGLAKQKNAFLAFSEKIISALKSLGITAYASGKNDIMIDGKKISGTAQRIFKNRILHHGTLLFSTDLDIIAKVLKKPQKTSEICQKNDRKNGENDLKSDEKDAKNCDLGGKDSRLAATENGLNENKNGLNENEICFDEHSKKTLSVSTSARKSTPSAVANISDFLSGEVSKDIILFKAALLASLGGEGLKLYPVTDTDLKEIDTLATDKYRTENWTYTSAPKCTYSAKQRFAGGSLEVLTTVENGLIKQIAFYGDFMARLPLDAVCDSLNGTPYDRNSVFKMLSSIPNFFDFFGSIAPTEIVDLMFS